MWMLVDLALEWWCQNNEKIQAYLSGCDDPDQKNQARERLLILFLSDLRNFS